MRAASIVLTLSALCTSVRGWTPAVQRVSRRLAGPRRTAQRSGGQTSAVVLSAAARTIAVSGLVESPDRSDQMVFDVLHAQPGAWSKIVAITKDAKFAKKRLLSRSARYTGLLDVLEIAETDAAALCASGGMAAKLKELGCDAWLAYDMPASEAAAACKAAADAGLSSLSMIVSGASAAEGQAAAAAALASAPDTLDWCVFAAAELTDGLEGQEPVRAAGCAADGECAAPAGPVVREDALRFAAEALLLEPAKGKAFALSAGDETVGKWLRMKREEGNGKQDEISAMFAGDFDAYETEAAGAAAKAEAKAKAEELSEEEVEVIAADREAEIQALFAKGDKEWDKIKEEKIEENARDLLVSEYRTKFWAKNNTLGEMTQDEYVDENLAAKVKEVGEKMVFDDNGNFTMDLDDDEAWEGGEDEDDDAEAGDADAADAPEPVAAGGAAPEDPEVGSEPSASS